MSFKQHLSSLVAAQLDETHRAATEEKGLAGQAYFDLHITTIDTFELAAPTFKEFLGDGKLRILESGCGTGRWMAYFERLGNRAFGIDDSWDPLRIARAHDPAMLLARADVLAAPFRSGVFDAAFSSYVAEHFEDGPEALFREIHRVLKPKALFFVVVPYDNTFRRWFVDPLLRLIGFLWVLRGKRLGFTEFRYRRAEMDGFLQRAGFEILRVQPDDFRAPWSKGLFVDFCDVASFFNYAPQPQYQFQGMLGRLVRGIQRFDVWHWCEGIFYVCRAKEVSSGQGAKGEGQGVRGWGEIRNDLRA